MCEENGGVQLGERGVFLRPHVCGQESSHSFGTARRRFAFGQGQNHLHFHVSLGVGRLSMGARAPPWQ